MNFSEHDKKEIAGLIVETVGDLVLRSHKAIEASTSNTGSDIARIKEHIESIDRENIARNGSFARAVDNLTTKITELKTAETEIRSSIKGASNTGKIAISIIVFLLVSISSIGLYAYENDKSNLKENDEKLAKELTNYQASVNASTEKIFELLNQIKNK